MKVTITEVSTRSLLVVVIMVFPAPNTCGSVRLVDQKWKGNGHETAGFTMSPQKSSEVTMPGSETHKINEHVLLLMRSRLTGDLGPTLSTHTQSLKLNLDRDSVHHLPIDQALRCFSNGLQWNASAALDPKIEAST